MTQQEVRRVVAGVAARLGGGDRRRIDHHQTERGSSKRAPEQRAVEFRGGPLFAAYAAPPRLRPPARRLRAQRRRRARGSRETCRNWRRPATAARHRRTPRAAAARAPHPRASRSAPAARRTRASALAMRAASRPISSTRARTRRDRCGERREVLALAVAAGDQHDAAIRRRQAAQRGHRGADVGALRVVVPGDARRSATRCHAVRQSVEARAARGDQRRVANAERVRERRGGERIGDVVQSVHAQARCGAGSVRDPARARSRRRARATPKSAARGGASRPKLTRRAAGCGHAPRCARRRD